MSTETLLSGAHDSWRERLPSLPICVAAAVLLMVLELLAMAWIANGQVVRSSQQQAQANALRVRLWNCLDAGPGALVDRCRAQVMASIAQDGNAPAAALPVPASLALWSSEAGAATELPRSAVLPVSMVQGLR